MPGLAPRPDVTALAAISTHSEMGFVPKPAAFAVSQFHVGASFTLVPTVDRPLEFPTAGGCHSGGLVMSLFQLFSAFGDVLEKFGDRPVHELDIGDLGRRGGEMALQRWDHDIAGARDGLGVLGCLGGRVVEITGGVYLDRFFFYSPERLCSIAI